MLEIIKTAGFIVAVIFTIIIGFYFLVKILRNLDTIFKFFISALTPIFYVLGTILGIFVYNYIFSEIYKFNNLIGIVGVIITLSALIFYLHKKFDILTFLKQFTGISEYDSKSPKLKKFLKILQISFTIIIFSAIAIAFFSKTILSIFNPILAM